MRLPGKDDDGGIEIDSTSLPENVIELSTAEKFAIWNLETQQAGEEGKNFTVEIEITTFLVTSS